MKTIHLSKSLIAFLFVSIAVSSFAVKPPAGPTITQATGYISNHTLIIIGTNFAAPVVNLDNMNLVVTSSNATTINATLPAMIGPGSYHLRVTTGGGIANIDLALDNGDVGNNNTSKGLNALANLTNGTNNSAFGSGALLFNTTGQFNNAFGQGALASNDDGNFNNAHGDSALIFNVHGDNNTAFGDLALVSNDASGNGLANQNTAVGAQALTSNHDGADNTAVGFAALVNNDFSGNGLANQNTAVGSHALTSNNDGHDNTAIGFQALNLNDDGDYNNAVGSGALASNVSSFFNNALGHNALNANTGGQNNALGDEAMISNTTGGFNTAIGDDALHECTDCDSNVVIGDEAGTNLTSGGEGNIYIGAQANNGADGEVEFIRIGNDTAFAFPYDTFIAGIYNRSYGPADMAVRIGSDGKLGTVVSSRRFKHDIKPLDNASEAILALKPVTFLYNSDATNTPRVGFIAEEVAEVSPDLVIRDKEGKPLSVRYEDVNVMLLNEFIKEHKKVEQQQASIIQLKSEMQTMVAQLKEQAAQIQKVSAQVEMTKPATKVAAGNQ